MSITIPIEIHKGPWIIKQSDFEELEKVIIEVEGYLEESLELEIIDSIEKSNKENRTEELKQRLANDIRERTSSKKEKKVTLSIR